MTVRKGLASGAALLALVGGAVSVQTATAPPAAAASCGYHSGNQTARLGHTGNHVREVQCALNKIWGGAPLAVDGIFGPKTEARVKSFQQWERITVDGIVGPMTWRSIRAYPN
ncbi:peptidoglycan-binding domain-containing protein [Streptomyces poriticola]|uniref:peptidoglycan-binding domain-containing protein n=1 Tax=Streptomyces poriticola TaxID=3120506 RepID=UPI002FCE33B0